MATEIADELAGGGQPKGAVLIIVGEPFSDNHKTLILEEIVKGFSCWDSESTGIDINDELAHIANRAALGEEGPNGERIIRHRSDRLAVECLVNPQSQTVKESLKAVLTQLSPVKAVIYAGYAFQGTPAWVVQDELFTFATFNQMFKDPNVENALKQMPDSTMMMYTASPNDWTVALKGSDVERHLKVMVNPKGKLDHTHGVIQFSAYITNFIRAVPLSSVLQASDVIGNISFTRPVLYIFPGYQGDSALFGMKGFNMLVDGGYSRRACFWDFTRHLDCIDALLLTHLGPDNLFGAKALLERKGAETIHPDLDYIYMNSAKGGNGSKAVTNGDVSADAEGDLIINLAAEGNRLVELGRKLGHTPYPLTRPVSGNLEPINLFHKVGKGSLDMYILNPVADAKETKDFLAQWGKGTASFTTANGIPIPNCASICALLVVRPASATEKVTRILFPGTAPQHKLIEGLERVKNLEFLKHPTYCSQDSHKPKKPASSASSTAASAPNGRAGSATRKQPSTRPASSTKPEPPKQLEKKPATPRSSTTTSSAKAAKQQKETSNKRVSSAKDKEKVKLDEKEKEDKSKSSGSSSPSKASVKTASPAKTPSTPSKTPATATPEDFPSPAVVASHFPVPEPEVAEQPAPAANHLDQDPFQVGDNRVADSPEALPEPEQAEAGAGDIDSFQANEREKLRDLGIYDDDEGVDTYDDKENGGMFDPRGSPIADEEEQPQPLPEPIHTADAESPSGPEPDLIQDTFPKQSAMEQSQIFEDGIEPDYSGDAGVTSPGDIPQREEPNVFQQFDKEPTLSAEEENAQRYSPEPEQQDDIVEREHTPEYEKEYENEEFNLEPEQQQFSQEQEQGEFSPEPEFEKEASPAVESLQENSPELEQEKEFSPEPEQEKEFSPEPEEKEFSPEPEEKEFSPEPEQEKEFSPEPEQEKEFSPEPEQEEFNSNWEQQRESSPEPEQKEFSPELEEEKEPSPAPEQQSFSDKESSPELQEPAFEEEHEVSEGNNTIEQNIQYGVMGENGFQMGGIREEEEEEEPAAEKAAQAKQDMMDQARELNKRTMEELGIYDEDEDADEHDKDAYVYEKDVNLDDEEVRMADTGAYGVPQAGAYRDEEEYQDQPSSNIPEAFEKDETPPMEEQTPQAMESESGQVDSGREDTDSIDGGTPDDDKDIDEILAMRQKQQTAHMSEEEDRDQYNPNSGQDAPSPFNSFVGLESQKLVGEPDSDGAKEVSPYQEDELEHGDARVPGDFDPMSQWGPPTGLPAPASPQAEEADDQQEMFEPQYSNFQQEEQQEEHIEGAAKYDSLYQGPGAGEYDNRLEAGDEDQEIAEKLSDVDPTEFDPMREWGHPMGLPSPPPPETENKSPAKPEAKKADAKKADAKKASPTKAAAEKRPTSSTTKAKPKPANGTAEPPKSARSKPEPKAETKKANLDTSRSARPASAPRANLNSSRVEPAKPRPAASAPTKRPASAATASKARASPEVVKMPPLPALTPYYVDLTYIPNHGDLSYVDAEFFKRIRARYYVLSARNPNPKVLELLMEAKSSWDKSNEAEVTVIPTYETQILQHWMAVHKEKLDESKIDIAPAASRCTVRLQDHEASCYTYRLEF